MSINDKYSITWENSVYTITYDVTPVVTVQISSYGLSLFPSYRNPDVFYMGPTDQNLTTLNWTLCTSPANADFPRTMQGLLTAIQNLNTGQATYGSLDLVASDGTDGHPASSGDLTVGGSVDIDGATTFGGTVTANADAIFNYPVTMEDTLTVGGDLTVNALCTFNNNVEVVGQEIINGSVGIVYSSPNPLYFSNTNGTVNINPTSYPSDGCFFDLPALGNGTTDTLATLGLGQTFTGANTFSGTTTISGALDATSTLSVTDASTLSGDVSVGGTLSVTGTSSLTGDVTTTNALTVGTDLTVDGTSTFSETVTVDDNVNITGGNLAVTSTEIPGATPVGGNLSITGTSSLTGDVTTTNALTVGTNLTVDGTSSLTGDVTTTNALTVGTNLTVDGTSTLTGAVTCSDILATPSINVNSGGALTSLYAVSATIITADGYYASLNCTIVVVGSMCFFNFPGLSFSAQNSDAVSLSSGWPSGIVPLNSTYGYFPGQVSGTWTMMAYYVFADGTAPDIYLMNSNMTNLTYGTAYYFPAFVISWAI